MLLCNMSCTTGSVDDVMFSHNGANGPKASMALCFVKFTKWWHQWDIRQCYVRSNSPDDGTVGEVAVCSCILVDTMSQVSALVDRARLVMDGNSIY